MKPTDTSTPPRALLSDTASLRARAKVRLADGAVTHGYRADRDAVVDLLNRSLATEIVCVLRYKRHAFTAKGLSAEPIAEEFQKHAAEELEHADRIAARIGQLGGEPDFSPERLTARSHAEYDESLSLLDMIKADLVAERVAIDSYSEMIRWLGDADSTTRRMIEEILAMEEEHAVELADLLTRLGPPAA
jgi:bacterioferritin